MNDKKEAKSLTFRRGSEVSQASTQPERMSKVEAPIFRPYTTKGSVEEPPLRDLPSRYSRKFWAKDPIP